MATQKSGSSKLVIAVGSLVAVALIFGVLHKTGNLSTQDDYELTVSYTHLTLPTKA